MWIKEIPLGLVLNIHKHNCGSLSEMTANVHVNTWSQLSWVLENQSCFHFPFDVPVVFAPFPEGGKKNWTNWGNQFWRLNILIKEQGRQTYLGVNKEDERNKKWTWWKQKMWRETRDTEREKNYRENPNSPPKSSAAQMKGYFYSDSAIGFHDRWQIFVEQLIPCRALVAQLNVPTD